jgi:hypothetical protein
MDRLLSFLVALCLAWLAWLYARNRDPEILDNVPVPVQVTLAPGQAEAFDLEVTGPCQIPVSFRGPTSRIAELRNLLQEGGLHVRLAVTVPEERMNEARYLDTLRVSAADIHPPPGVTPMVVEGRNLIPITLRRLVQRRLRVRLDAGPLAEDGVSQVVLEPATVLVRGPKVILDRLRTIPTQACLVPGPGDAAPTREVEAVEPVAMIRELEGRPITTVPEVVLARFTFRAREKLYELSGVPISFLCPANCPWKPRFLEEAGGTLSLRILGPPRDQPPTVVAYVDLTARAWQPGPCMDEAVRIQLPRDYRLAQDVPRAPAFQLLPADGGNRPPAFGFRLSTGANDGEGLLHPIQQGAEFRHGP